MAVSSRGIACLVTIHGIGFQQAPDDAKRIEGYADGLHQHLRGVLGSQLSDDPHRGRGAIYVQSSWPTSQGSATRSVELGLSRLGSRQDPQKPTLDTSGAPLVNDGSRIAHVALVYTPAEETGPDPVSSLETAVLGLSSFEHYISPRHAVGMIGSDVWAIVHPPAGAAQASGSGNVPRLDPIHGPGHMQRLLQHLHPSAAPQDAAGAYTVLRTLEDDVAGYVARNVLRERVRDFVSEVLLRLQQRGDVSSIVVNSHSQGTVAAFDTLRTAPYEVIERVAAWFTMGSPLRKYAETLSWGTDVGRIAVMASASTPSPSWINVWDQRDPVADPLQPGAHWRRGDPRPAAAEEQGLFRNVSPETGEATTHPLEDIGVDNVGNTGGTGLRAHDYWNNVKEVVPLLADRLRVLAS